jgi:hypothetical protein
MIVNSLQFINNGWIADVTYAQGEKFHEAGDVFFVGAVLWRVCCLDGGDCDGVNYPHVRWILSPKNAEVETAPAAASSLARKALMKASPIALMNWRGVKIENCNIYEILRELQSKLNEAIYRLNVVTEAVTEGCHDRKE